MTKTNGSASRWAVGTILGVVLVAGGWGVSYAIGRTDAVAKDQSKHAERIVAVETTQASQAATLERIEEKVDDVSDEVTEILRRLPQ